MRWLIVPGGLTVWFTMLHDVDQTRRSQFAARFKRLLHMIEGSCHCGAIRFVFLQTPEWLTRCNCSQCRRSAALWAHSTRENIKLTYAPDDAIHYVWGDKSLATVSCKRCGCTTHWENLDPSPTARMAVNTNMADPIVIKGLRIRLFDGADTWKFLN
ncbi:MAG: GFA family protein [Micropepsaceae bacterium]